MPEPHARSLSQQDRAARATAPAAGLRRSARAEARAPPRHASRPRRRRPRRPACLCASSPAIDAGQHVAGAGRRQQRRAVGVDRGAAVRRGDHRVRSLVDDDRVGRASPPRVRARSSFDRISSAARSGNSRANSPSCGVRTIAGALARRAAAKNSSRCAPRRRESRRRRRRCPRTMPAARGDQLKREVADLVVRAEARTEDQRARACARREIPGPPRATSVLRRMIEVRCAALTASALAGDSSVTAPAPARAAAIADKPRRAGRGRAAGKHADMAARSICGCRPPARETRPVQRSAAFSKQSDGRIASSTSAAMPMSATIISPQSVRARIEQMPRLLAEEGDREVGLETPRQAPRRSRPKRPTADRPRRPACPRVGNICRRRGAASPSSGFDRPAPNSASTTSAPGSA